MPQKTTTKKGAKSSKRLNERLSIQFVVDYMVEGAKSKAKSKAKKEDKLPGDYFFDFAANLGSGGVFIRTKKPQGVDKVLTLKFTMPGSRKSLKVKGKVMWVQEADPKNEKVVPGMGVQFIDLPSDIRERIVGFIAKQKEAGAEMV